MGGVSCWIVRLRFGWRNSWEELLGGRVDGAGVSRLSYLQIRSSVFREAAGVSGESARDQGKCERLAAEKPFQRDSESSAWWL